MTYIMLALSFLKVGLLGFGGGYAMIPLIQKEVGKFAISGPEFIDIIAISQMTPGPVGVNAATYTGYRVAGVLGSVLATFSNTVPTFILMLIVSRLFYIFRKNLYVEMFFKGLRPVFIGLITASVLFMARDIRLWADYKGVLIALFVFIAGYKFKANPVLLILFSGVVGYLVY